MLHLCFFSLSLSLFLASRIPPPRSSAARPAVIESFSPCSSAVSGRQLYQGDLPQLFGPLCFFVLLAREHNHCLLPSIVNGSAAVVTHYLWPWMAGFAVGNVSKETTRYDNECGDVMLQSTLASPLRVLATSDCGLFFLSFFSLLQRCSSWKTTEGRRRDLLGAGYCLRFSLLPLSVWSLRGIIFLSLLKH